MMDTSVKLARHIFEKKKEKLTPINATFNSDITDMSAVISVS